MKRIVTAAVLLSVCAACGRESSSGSRYGFVTVLGNDTVAVERITRTADRLVSDDVDRWPSVKVRHTEMMLAPDGKITHVDMEVHTPNGATPKARERHVTADLTADSVKISIRDSSGVKDTAFATGGAITVPHVSMMYSVIEQEIAAALMRASSAHLAPGDSVQFRQWYPDRDIGESFVLHQGFVRPSPGGKVELWHDWLSGVADVVVDTNRQMLSYSGARSTYKVAVTRVAVGDVPDIDTFGAKLAAAEKAAGGIKQLSVRDTARGTVGAATISVDYGRPLARGRELLGKVIEYDYVWRTGANAATQFTTTASITLAGIPLAAGTYTLWTAPHANGVVDLIVNKETGQWGTDYDSAHDLATKPLLTETVTKPVEEFTISVVPGDPHHASLVLEWGNFRWSAPIVVK
ncbi:MAG TPA: DUF2911 domain-containing protein [Gemmatimonadaceae bacterium]|nr:DUF2911 domain-containing protein [Gemmatimonadaceae bacterium]